MVGDILSFHHLNDALIAFCRLGILDNMIFVWTNRWPVGKVKGVGPFRGVPPLKSNIDTENDGLEKVQG